MTDCTVYTTNHESNEAFYSPNNGSIDAVRKNARLMIYQNSVDMDLIFGYDLLVGSVCRVVVFRDFGYI